MNLVGECSFYTFWKEKIPLTWLWDVLLPSCRSLCSFTDESIGNVAGGSWTRRWTCHWASEQKMEKIRIHDMSDIVDIFLCFFFKKKLNSAKWTSSITYMMTVAPFLTSFASRETEFVDLSNERYSFLSDVHSFAWQTIIICDKFSLKSMDYN